jgi:autotransporter passenger strand-loop-strand repeat protein
MSAISVSSGVASSGIVLGQGGVLNVLSGGVAVSAVVNAGGIATVSGGGSAIGTIVNSRGLDQVLSGGVVSDTTVSANGGEKVYGRASGTVVGYAASQTVFAGGAAVGSLVDGSQIVSSGGVASGAELIEGVETISSGGVASGTVAAFSSGGVPGNGQISVASGGTMANAVINHDGYAALSAGALAFGTIVSGGDLWLGGGTAIGTTIGSGGVETVSTVYVFSASAYVSGVASATTIAGGTLALDGGSATGGILFTGSGPGLLEISGPVMPTTVVSGFAASNAIDLQSVAFTGSGEASLDASTDVLTVTEGGSSFALQLAGVSAGTIFDLSPDAASGTIVAIYDDITTVVSSGVASSGIVLGQGGVLNILSGGVAVSAVVNAGGIATVSGGGSAIGTIVNSRGLDQVLSGGVVSDTTVSAYGGEKVYGRASGTVVGYAASQTVFAGGAAVGSLVDGSQIVSSGGVASGAELIDGIETVLSGGVASGTVAAFSSGGVPGNGQISVASGGTMVAAVINHDGYAALSAGAVALGTIVSGGDLSLGGGTAIGTTIGSGGVETVSTVYVFSASAYVSGVASATTIAGGTLDLDGGSATGGILFTGSGPGLLEISGTVMPTTVVSGFAASDGIDLQNVAFTGSGEASLDASTDVLTVTEGGSSFALQLAGSYSGASFNLGPDAGSGTTVAIAKDSLFDIASGLVSSGIVLGNGGVLNVFSGGTAVSTTVNAGGLAAVSGGGTAIGTIVTSRGLDEVLSGGIAQDTTVSAYGGEAVYGAAIGTVVAYAGSETVLAGGSAVGSLVDGAEIVLSGGVTSGIELADGDEFVFSGGVASGTVVAVSAGGTFGDGEVAVAAGGTATSTLINSGGFVSISAGAFAVGTMVSGGGLALGGGTAIDTTIGSGGLETVFVTYVFSTGDYYSGVASATTIAGGTLDLEGGTATGGILFTGSGPGLLQISGAAMPGTAISGFGETDAIDLQSVAYTGSGVVSLDASTDVLTVTEGGSSVALQLAGSDADAIFALSPDTGSGTVIGVSYPSAVIGTSDVPCFAAGTRIATARGAVAVEQLAIGDRVMTVEGDTRPVTWIGSRRVDCRRHPQPAKVWPVVIAAHAFGPDAPQREVRLSPDHAIFAEDVLIPVKHLINGASIRQVVIPAITYFHVALDRHSVILAEGLPVESYLDTGDRPAFATEGNPTVLHPAFASERTDIALVVDALGYAPLRVTGPVVEQVRAQIRAQISKRFFFEKKNQKTSAS